MRRLRPGRGLLLVLLALVAIGALAIGRGAKSADTPQARADAIAARVKCPTCESQTVAQAKTSAARAVYAVILEQVKAGRSDAQILGYIESRYGEQQLVVPEARGIRTLLWILPVAVVVFGGAGVAASIRRNRPGGMHPTDADRALVARARHIDGDVATSSDMMDPS